MKNHTLWFLIFVKSTDGSVNVAVYVVDSFKVLTLTQLRVNALFLLYYRILIQGTGSCSGDKTHPLILSNINLLQILFYYFHYNTVYSVCCSITSQTFLATKNRPWIPWRCLKLQGVPVACKIPV